MLRKSGKTTDSGRRRRWSTAPQVILDQPPPHLLKRAERSTLVLHIGLHKTASSYLQGMLAAHRESLIEEGLLYPTTGIVDKGTTGTREGAGSGQALFTRRGRPNVLRAQLLAELPENVSSVLISSEEFSRAGGLLAPKPERLLSRFQAFGTVKVVLVLRRQDDWIESLYKQIVDQYLAFETRSFERYFRETGVTLLDFHSRFSPWRDLVGPENFHVLSYDDLDDGVAICRRILDIVGVKGPSREELSAVRVPRYDSVRAIDTVGLRLLNSYRLTDREARTEVARSIYDLAPNGDVELMSAEIREEIQAMCRPINERLEAEWFTEPVPRLRFGAPPRASTTSPPTGPEMVDYVDQVLALCEQARDAAQPDSAPGRDGE